MHIIKILIADDDPTEYHEFQQACADDAMDIVVSYAHTERTIETKARDVYPDVLLCDYAMPGIDTIALYRRLRNILPQALFVAYTHHIHGGIQLEQAGCDIHIPKETKPKVVLNVIREKLAYRSSPTTAQTIVAAVRQGASTRRSISDRTGIPDGTVRRHLQNLLNTGILQAAGKTHKRRYWLSTMPPEQKDER